MEIRDDNLPCRRHTYTKTRTLLDGTVKVYTYHRDYVPKTNTLQNAGKTELKRRIDRCKDRDVINTLMEILDESGY